MRVFVFVSMSASVCVSASVSADVSVSVSMSVCMSGITDSEICENRCVWNIYCQKTVEIS